MVKLNFGLASYSSIIIDTYLDFFVLYYFQDQGPRLVSVSFTYSLLRASISRAIEPRRTALRWLQPLRSAIHGQKTPSNAFAHLVDVISAHQKLDRKQRRRRWLVSSPVKINGYGSWL
jgi:hypothetical protein